MKLQLIRSATLRIAYAGRTLLIDPYLAPKGSRPSLTGKSRNPLVELPCSPDEVIAGVELVLVSHLHSDHFDPAAQALLPKDTPILCQPGDETRIGAHGFRRVTPVQGDFDWQGIHIRRVAGQHGSGAVLREMGEASGFILRAAGEPTLYWAGDTILNEAVRETIRLVQPEVIVTHSSGAVWGGGTLIVMDAEQTVDVCRSAPGSTVVATHMDSLDHGTVTRTDLRSYARAQGIPTEQLRIPEDGEQLKLSKITEK
jgi:L-ascorbate metabolism protein UlaG (beta-lactamase superfamily)